MTDDKTAADAAIRAAFGDATASKLFRTRDEQSKRCPVCNVGIGKHCRDDAGAYVPTHPERVR